MRTSSRGRRASRAQRGEGTARGVRGSEAVRAGELGRRRLQGPDFVALDHDVHVLATTPVDLAVRARAVLLRRPHGVIAGAAAAALWGAGEGEVGAVEVHVGRSGARRRDGVVLWHDHLEDTQVTELDGLRLTTPTRTAYDLSRRRPFPEGLAAADLLADRADVTGEGLHALVVRHAGSPGNGRARRAAAALDARSTPAVSRIRGACLDHEWPLVLSVRPIVELGDWFVVPDLADLGRRLAVFVGGDPSRSYRDLALLGRHGWTALQVAGSATSLVTEVAAVRARWREAARRDHEARVHRRAGEGQTGQPKAGQPTAESTATATNTAVR